MRGYTLFIDLDGTIIDASARLYRLHQDMVQKVGFTTPHSREEYIALKQIPIPEEEIISFITEPTQRNFYLQQRERNIEAWNYLALDVLFPWAKEALELLKKHNTLILCTRRRNEKQVLKQLHHLGINNLFHDSIISPEQKKEKIETHPQFVKKRSIIIGDTEEDIETGKKVGIKTIAVLSGYRNKEFLQKYEPDLIVENIKELKSITFLK